MFSYSFIIKNKKLFSKNNFSRIYFYKEVKNCFSKTKKGLKPGGRGWKSISRTEERKALASKTVGYGEEPSFKFWVKGPAWNLQNLGSGLRIFNFLYLLQTKNHPVNAEKEGYNPKEEFIYIYINSRSLTFHIPYGFITKSAICLQLVRYTKGKKPFPANYF